MRPPCSISMARPSPISTALLTRRGAGMLTVPAQGLPLEEGALARVGALGAGMFWLMGGESSNKNDSHLRSLLRIVRRNASLIARWCDAGAKKEPGMAGLKAGGTAARRLERGQRAVVAAGLGGGLLFGAGARGR